ncbi:MAG TPA: glycosyltransferase family 4 protein [Syntrophales bacterium]|nr:glycosyltransferase family 4 protein [Syntrophales bacterium]
MAHNSLKIAVSIPKYGFVGGAEHFVSELTGQIANNPHYDISVFANKWVTNSDRLTFYKIPIITFPRFLTTLSFACFVRDKMAKMNFDLIHTHDRIFDADIYTMHGVPHEFWIHEVRNKHMGLNDHATAWVERKLVRNPRCQRFISVSSLVKKVFLKYYDVDPERIKVIHPGVDVSKFTELDREQCRREIRSLLKIDPEDIVILFVSMNFDIKGLDQVLASMARAKTKYHAEKIKLLVVGRGDEKGYMRMARNMGIGGDVIFAGVHREKLDRIYLASDIFSILSKFDTFGIVVIEAMAASLPVILSGNVGAKDLVVDGANGFVIEERTDIDSVSEKIGILLNKETRLRMGVAARHTALVNTWEAVKKKYESIYDELLVRN